VYLSRCSFIFSCELIVFPIPFLDRDNKKSWGERLAMGVGWAWIGGGVLGGVYGAFKTSEKIYSLRDKSLRNKVRMTIALNTVKQHAVRGSAYAASLCCCYHLFKGIFAALQRKEDLLSGTISGALVGWISTFDATMYKPLPGEESDIVPKIMSNVRQARVAAILGGGAVGFLYSRHLGDPLYGSWWLDIFEDSKRKISDIKKRGQREREEREREKEDREDY